MILWLLSALLLAWEPLRIAGELYSTLPMIADRGAAAAVELGAHAVVAALGAAAGLALVNRNQAGPRLAEIALIASAARSVQTLYWSVLPRNVVPGDELPLAIAAVLYATAWVVYLRRSATVRTIFPT